ncbi:hypothetical protein HZC09_03415 [Candidatus Micrarchaeota archaeon]|nr:hypothetical protein [Candidatus Micrarchaeota archaeon]
MKRLLLFLLFLSSFAFALSSLKVPAVATNGQGLITDIETSISKDGGGVFVDIEPFISVETQNSAKTAALVAAKAAGKNLSEYRVFFKVVADTQFVDGPSGGLAMTLLAYSELKGKKIRPDITATGTIEVDGSVGQVGGVMEKVQAAAKHGVTLFLVPQGQSIQSGIDVAELAERQGVQVVEVRSFEEALKYAYTGKGVRVVVPERVEVPLVLENLTSVLPAYIVPMRELAQSNYEKLSSARAGFASDSVIAAVLKKAENRSRAMIGNGYYYSAANEAFLALIQADSFRLVNVSKNDLLAKVSSLDSALSAFKPIEVNDRNIEWAVGSRLRAQWAKERVAELKEKLKEAEQTSAFVEDYAASENWFSAAKQMDYFARRLDGMEIDGKAWTSYAYSRLLLANATYQENQDTEALFHLEASKNAFVEGDYLTSSFDSSFAIGFAEAYGELLDLAESGAMPENPVSKDKMRGHTSMWGLLYYGHALYSMQEANRSKDLGYVVNAFKLSHLAEQLDLNLKNLGGVPPFSGLPANATVEQPKAQTSIVVTTVPSSPDPLLYGAVIAVVVVVFVALVLVFAMRPRPGKMSKQEKVDMLEQRLLEGHISESTYKTLSRKFESVKRGK